MLNTCCPKCFVDLVGLSPLRFKVVFGDTWFSIIVFVFESLLNRTLDHFSITYSVCLPVLQRYCIAINVVANGRKHGKWNFVGQICCISRVRFACTSCHMVVVVVAFIIVLDFIAFDMHPMYPFHSHCILLYSNTLTLPTFFLFFSSYTFHFVKYVLLHFIHDILNILLTLAMVFQRNFGTIKSRLKFMLCQIANAQSSLTLQNGSIPYCFFFFSFVFHSIHL